MLKKKELLLRFLNKFHKPFQISKEERNEKPKIKFKYLTATFLLLSFYVLQKGILIRFLKQFQRPFQINKIEKRKGNQ